MNEQPAYVVVGPGGLPQPAATPVEAATIFHRQFYFGGGTERQINETVEKLLIHGKVEQQGLPMDGVNPRSAIIVNNAEGRFLEEFVNAHLWQWPRSHTYVVAALQAYELRNGPRLGDFCERPGVNQPLRRVYSRFTYGWDDTIQTGGGNGFWIGSGGEVSYSGGLDPGVKRDCLVDTGKRRWASFWFFKDGSAGAHRGIDILLPVRVYRANEPDNEV